MYYVTNTLVCKILYKIVAVLAFTHHSGHHCYYDRASVYYPGVTHGGEGSPMSTISVYYNSVSVYYPIVQPLEERGVP